MFQLFLSRNVLTQIVGIVFALLAALHVALPAPIDQASVVAAGMLIMAAVSAVTRFGRAGDPESDAKAWWQSRTIWTAIVAAGVATAVIVAAIASINLGAVDQEGIVAAIMIVVGVVNVWLHRRSAHRRRSRRNGGKET